MDQAKEKGQQVAEQHLFRFLFFADDIGKCSDQYGYGDQEFDDATVDVNILPHAECKGDAVAKGKGSDQDQ